MKILLMILAIVLLLVSAADSHQGAIGRGFHGRHLTLLPDAGCCV